MTQPPSWHSFPMVRRVAGVAGGGSQRHYETCSQLRQTGAEVRAGCGVSHPRPSGPNLPRHDPGCAGAERRRGIRMEQSQRRQENCQRTGKGEAIAGQRVPLRRQVPMAAHPAGGREPHDCRQKGDEPQRDRGPARTRASDVRDTPTASKCVEDGCEDKEEGSRCTPGGAGMGQMDGRTQSG